MNKKLRIFLLNSNRHPEDLAAMGAEKDIIERDHRFEAYNPGDAAHTGLSSSDRIKVEFRHDVIEMMKCDGVLLMAPIDQLFGTNGNVLHAVAVRAGLPMKDNTGDLMDEMWRKRRTLTTRTHPNPEPIYPEFKAIGHVHENTIPLLEMGVVCSAVITPTDENSPDKRHLPREQSKYPATLYAKVNG